MSNWFCKMTDSNKTIHFRGKLSKCTWVFLYLLKKNKYSSNIFSHHCKINSSYLIKSLLLKRLNFQQINNNIYHHKYPLTQSSDFNKNCIIAYVKMTSFANKINPIVWINLPNSKTIVLSSKDSSRISAPWVNRFICSKLTFNIRHKRLFFYRKYNPRISY